MARIALIGENSTSFVKELIDIWNSGDCAVLIDWRTPISTAIEMMREAKVSECRIENEIFDKAGELNSTGVTFLTFERDKKAQLLPQSIYDSFKENYSTSEAVIIYSSGTTGKAKGIILSHYAINTNADAIIDYFRPNENDCMYLIKNIAHSSSITGEVLVALKTHTKLLISPTVVPPRYTLTNIQKYKVTKIFINPTLLKMYIEETQRRIYSFSFLKEIYVHGAKANSKLCYLASNSFKNVKIYYEYGLSEAGPRVTSQKVSNKSIDSVGKAINGIEIAIINEFKNVVESGRLGIIHVKTPSVFMGYALGKEKFKSLYKDWLNTGDIGYFDSVGELHIVDRVDDVINICAHKIYPSDVEQTILSMDGINECSVTKIVYENEEFVGCLYVGNQIMQQEFCNYLAKKLLPYEIPKVFIKTETIPRTLNGKVSKKDVAIIIVNALKHIKDD